MKILLAILIGLTSPNGKFRAEFSQTDTMPYVTTYTLTYEGDTVVAPSRLGLNLDNRCWEMALGMRTLPQYDCWMDPMQFDSVSLTSNSAAVLYLSRKPERPIAPTAPMGNARMADSDGLVRSNYRLNIEVLLSDDGLAFRYFFPEHPAAVFHKVTEDLTTYHLPEGTIAYSEQWAQAGFELLPIDSITHPVEMPLLCHNGNLWTAILTANTSDWCLTKLTHTQSLQHEVTDTKSSTPQSGTLHSQMYSPIDLVTYYATPWKIIMAARTPGAILEKSVAFVDGLNPDPQGDFSWVEPGKIMRETTLTMEGARATIDFCAEHGIRYMLFDWKWYEPCTSHDGDATRVIDRLDMPAICRYAQSRGVGVWLYVNQHALMKQARELFPILREWGVVGVKSGFVQYASHRWNTWLHDLVRLAAENHLMMNIHDEYRPTGFSHTYPNLLTQEGILGNEEFPDGDHDVRLAFTRMLCGAADYTICYYDHRFHNTHAHQLAASMVFGSPLVTVFWYDKPQQYSGEPEISWFEQLPTTWDETRVLAGDPESYILMARRKGDIWYIAALNNSTERDIEIDLSMLMPIKSKIHYTLYQDDDSVPTKTHVAIADRDIKSLTQRNSKLPLHLRANGGATMIIQ